jgi:hypothetical protein
MRIEKQEGKILKKKKPKRTGSAVNSGCKTISKQNGGRLRKQREEGGWGGWQKKGQRQDIGSGTLHIVGREGKRGKSKIRGEKKQ